MEPFQGILTDLVTGDGCSLEHALTGVTQQVYLLFDTVKKRNTSIFNLQVGIEFAKLYM